MSKGFLWFAQNNDQTDYVRLSIALAKSIKRYNRENKICVITDEKSKFDSEFVDVVKVLDKDDSADHEIKWANEYKAFRMSPFTHTIKLEADMLWRVNTDWWWHHLWQHDLVFSVDCLNYRNKVVKNTLYRKLFVKNLLPNIYNGLMYFRRSQKAKQFYDIAEVIFNNWDKVRSQLLVACHDKYPSTDLVFALAYRIMDPTHKGLIDFEWFKFIHNKSDVHKTKVVNHNDYLLPNRAGEKKLYIGETLVNKVFHYHDKELDVIDI